jgi:hypothetical protein
MSGMLDDLEKRIDQERALQQQKKLEDKQRKAKEEAEKAQRKAKDNNSLLW